MRLSGIMLLLKVEHIYHNSYKTFKEADQLTLNFEFDKDLISTIKTIDDARRSSTMKCRHVPDDSDISPCKYKEFTDDKIAL